MGLDTSVVIRLLTGLPEDMARRAARAVQTHIAVGDAVLVSDLVVSEAYFALQHHYQLSKAEALDSLRTLLGDGGLQPSGAAATVLDLPRLASGRPGFVDRLIHAGYLRSADRMLTFERAASRLQGVQVLPG